MHGTTGTGNDHRPRPVHRSPGPARRRSRASVVVVGAGPTGLLLAGDLAEAGVPVTLVEKRPPGSATSRAPSACTPARWSSSTPGGPARTPPPAARARGASGGGPC